MMCNNDVRIFGREEAIAHPVLLPAGHHRAFHAATHYVIEVASKIDFSKRGAYTVTCNQLNLDGCHVNINSLRYALATF
jgi:hypothetical protein